MKKSLLFFVILAFAATACEKEIADDNNSKVNPEEGTYLLEIKATIDEPDIVDNAIQSKATYSSNKVVFAIGDEIGVLGTTDGSTWTAYTLRATKIENNTITFSATVPDGTTIGDYAYYPASIATTSPLIINWPTSIDGSKVQVPMIGIIDTESATKKTTFKHLGAIIEINAASVPAGATVLQFKNNSAPITGSYTIAFSSDYSTLSLTANNVNLNTIDASIDSDSDGNGENGTYYIPVPAAEYTDFTFSLTDGSGNYYKQKTAKSSTSITLARGMHANFGTLTYDLDEIAGLYMVGKMQGWSLSNTSIRYIKTGANTYRVAATTVDGDGYKIMPESAVNGKDWTIVYGMSSTPGIYIANGNNIPYGTANEIFTSTLTTSESKYVSKYIGSSGQYDYGCVSMRYGLDSGSEAVDLNFVEGSAHNWAAANFTIDSNSKIYFKFIEDHVLNAGGNWGGGISITDDKPYGTCVNGSSDNNSYQLTQGTYTIYFNDVTGDFMFVKQ
ncbi:MAG: hypothetical protein K6A94_01515 [Bacteroidales bacterium]|nr:hypothetical protein [Bacteroidales bacterium]